MNLLERLLGSFDEDVRRGASFALGVLLVLGLIAALLLVIQWVAFWLLY